MPENKDKPSQSQALSKPVGQSLDAALRGKKQKSTMHKAVKGVLLTGLVAGGVAATAACVALFIVCIPLLGTV